MALASDTTSVHRLKVRGPGLDPVTTPLRLTSLLAGVDVRPPRMPPAATLIVRRVRDPSPGSLRLTAGGGPSRAWERAVRDSLSDYYSRAWRPALGRPASEPDAVLFMDNAELLAQLALDIRAGRATRCWWWRNLLRDRPASPHTLTALLVDDAAAVPAVVTMLAQQGQSEAIVGMLTPAMASAVLQAVERAYRLPDLRVGTAAETLQPTTDQPTKHEATALRHPDAPARSGAPPPTWEPPGDAEGSLAPVQRLLLGLAMELARRPGVVYTSTFVQQVRRWWAVASAPAQRLSPVVPATTVPGQRYRAADEASAPGRHVSEPATSPPVGPPETRSAVRPAGEPVLQADTVPAGEAPARSSHAKVAASHAESPGEGPPAASALVADAAPAAPAHALDATAPYWGIDGVGTELAGAFFLCNLLVYLELPACLETDSSRASPVGFWETLDLLARALIPNPPRDIVHDALWDVLAALDGRQPAEPIGSGVRADHLVLPRAWLAQEPAGPGRLQWCVRGARVWLWSEDGYVLAMLPAGAEPPRTTVAGCLEALGLAQSELSDEPSTQAPPVASLSPPLLTLVAPGARDWLAFVAPFVKRRLARALGLDTRDADLTTALLLRSGTVYVTPMYVDVVMPLESIRLPVRLAGLDRDPGWLPQAGRVVKLYFQ